MTAHRVQLLRHAPLPPFFWALAIMEELAVVLVVLVLVLALVMLLLPPLVELMVEKEEELVLVMRLVAVGLTSLVLPGESHRLMPLCFRALASLVLTMQRRRCRCRR